MKLFTKILLLCLLYFSLASCMDTVTRLWNGGPYISKAEHKAFAECIDEANQKLDSSEPKNIYTNPDPQLHREHQAWLALHNQEVANCMERKGYR
ncbi:hypothetical protein [Stenoxybacter acetivorans]|uniref:hypothetical protein n=1 Tax=Stenoxybacter acetivorans TaxID=422441 RepID=UPI00055FA903|nr:hypothetical protein [Stenoxybacter acetivorans]